MVLTDDEIRNQVSVVLLDLTDENKAGVLRAPLDMHARIMHHLYDLLPEGSHLHITIDGDIIIVSMHTDT